MRERARRERRGFEVFARRRGVFTAPLGRFRRRAERRGAAPRQRAPRRGVTRSSRRPCGCCAWAAWRCSTPGRSSRKAGASPGTGSPRRTCSSRFTNARRRKKKGAREDGRRRDGREGVVCGNPIREKNGVSTEARVFQRYCHVYKEGELEALFDPLREWCGSTACTTTAELCAEVTRTK